VSAFGRCVAGAGLLALGAAASAQPAPARRGFAVQIEEPADQSIVFGKSPIIATVEIADAALVDRVEFYVGDELVFVDREPPWECSYDFGEESKAWVIRADAWHRENVSVSDSVTTRRIPFIAIERVNRVLLWVSARDRDGRFVTELRQDQLSLFEEGRAQPILEFTREERPITMAILLDSSGSMKEQLEEVHHAASSFVDTLREGDQALVIDFDDKVFLVQDLTFDRAALKAAIQSTEAIGGTAIYDALHAAYRKIGKLTGRKAIVLLSDGDDTASQFGFQRAIEEAKSNNTIIYSIGLGDGGGGAHRGPLKEFAEVTGGRAFFIKKASDLETVYRLIAEELRAQYYVAYATTNETWDGRWIPLRMETTQPGLELNHRSGFFAVRTLK
jgi:VWFA-related protein